MKRILIIGNSPLPYEKVKSRPAAGLRTYQFLSQLTREGGNVPSSKERAFSGSQKTQFKVFLVTVAMPECYSEGPGRKEIRHSDDYFQLQISKDDRKLESEIQRVHDEFHPDAVVGVNSFCADLACRLETAVPVWADLNGWIMAEGQAQAFRSGHNDFLPHYFDIERTVLERADRISVVSGPQKYAVTGELAGVGRMVGENFIHQLVSVVPNATEYFPGERDGMAGAGAGDGGVGGGESKLAVAEEVGRLFEKVPKEATVALWLGGYNTWVDEETLFEGVEKAMAESKDLYFVSTGGEVKGLDDKTFVNFKKMVDGSRFKDRFVFLGWVDSELIPAIYARADVGLNIDRDCIETRTGARNRINEMMKFGLPVITTYGSEISGELARVKAGVVIESGSSEQLKEALISARGLKELGKNGRKYIEEECNYAAVMGEFAKWLEDPRPAPDRYVKMNLKNKRIFRSALRYLKQNGLGKFFKKAWQRVGRIWK